MTDFPRLLAALTDAGVRFIIVGGASAIAHGSARLTQDLDVVYDRSPDNLQRVVAALAPHRPYLRGAPPGLFGRPSLCLGLEKLIAVKRAAGRPKDLEAIAELEVILRGPDLD